MIKAVIHWSLTHRGWVLLAALIIMTWGGWTALNAPVDAIPDVSDVQVIVKTRYPGQNPQVVEDQITYPLSLALSSVPGATTTRGFSFQEDSYIYVVFEEGVDLYWARSRVMESLAQATASLPQGVVPTLGPDASGVGWILVYALVDRTDSLGIAELRSLQDWYLKVELQSVPGVAEVATVGGMVRQYQVTADPVKLQAYEIPITHLASAIKRANGERGASVLEIAEAEYRIRATGYLSSVADLRQIPLGQSVNGQSLTLGDVADVVVGPAMRRNVADLDGEGEATGGIIVMRSGANPREVIRGVESALTRLKSGLPEGVEVVTVYDRSGVIDRAVDTLIVKVGQEIMLVALACWLFFGQLRLGVLAAIGLPLGVLIAFIVMSIQGLTVNIMSLGGIAIAIGAMSDSAIVMIDSLYRHLGSRRRHEEYWTLVYRAMAEVGPSLWVSLIIVTVSFLPVFLLQSQEGRLFNPLAYTKTWAMAASAVLAITVTPVLVGYALRSGNVTQREPAWWLALTGAYRRALKQSLLRPRLTLLLASVIFISSLWPLRHMGSEFMPALDEGDLMYMPTTYPSVSIGTARQLLQQTDRLIATVPEVERVFGKVGRADTATDPAPLTMIETFIKLKPQDQWREGLTSEDLRHELNGLVTIPGLANAWVMPIKTRIDMLATGVKTPLGIRVSGPDLLTLQQITTRIEQLLEALPGTHSIYAERVAAGRYVTIDIDRHRAASWGLNIADIHDIIDYTVGGAVVTNTLEGRERYSVNLRYPSSWRDSVKTLEQLPFVTSQGIQLALGDVASIRIDDGPSVIKSEQGRPSSWVLIDLSSSDLAGYVASAQDLIEQELTLPPGYSVQWTGQYEAMQRANARLKVAVPITIAVVAVLLYAHFRRWRDVAVILITLPLAMTGAFWLLWLLNYSLSVAVWVGIIAVVGVSTEMAVLMMVYLNRASREREVTGVSSLLELLCDAAVLRLRPVLMTVATLVVALLPVLLGAGTGTDVMQRIVAPMVGGMLSAFVLAMFVVPAAYLILSKPPAIQGSY